MPKIKFIILFFVTTILVSSRGGFVYAQQNVPQRIISFSPSLTENLYLLNVIDKLVGNTVYCKRPPDAKTKEKIGTAKKVNIEKIVSLKPDLVLATSLTRPEAKRKLENLGMQVVSFNAAKTFQEICDQFLKLGKLVGQEGRAEEMVNNARDSVNAIRHADDNSKKPRVFVQIGAKPLVTVTREYFLNDLVEFAGGINITRDAKNKRYSREKVLQDNPDVIIIVTMGLNGETEKAIWERYQSLKAVQTKQIYIMDSKLLCIPTLPSFVQSLGRVSKVLQ